MHELTTVAALCARAEEVARADGASRVTSVAVRIGALSHLSADHLRAHFSAMASGSVLEGARLDLTVDTDASDPAAQDVELLSVEVM